MFRTAGFRTIASTDFLRVDRLHVAGPDGTALTREVVRHPGAVGIVAVVDDAFVLIRQYRAPIDAWVLEIPAGKLDRHGEPPEKAAARELAEEVGLRPGTLERLCHFVTAPGFADEWLTVYLATGCTPVAMAPDGAEEEVAEIVHVPLNEVAGMIADGRIEDAKTIIGLLVHLRAIDTQPGDRQPVDGK